MKTLSLLMTMMLLLTSQTVSAKNDQKDKKKSISAAVAKIFRPLLYLNRLIIPKF